MKEKTFFDRNTGKANFIMGLAFGILGILAVGFFVMIPVLFTPNDAEMAQTGSEPKKPIPAAPLPEEIEPAVKQSFTIAESDHYRGNFDAPVTLVEFSDFQCSYCSRFKSTVKEIMEAYGDNVRVVFKHFPLSSHPEALPAAVATECAYEQKGNDGFYALHDVFFENQEKLGDEYYMEVAEENGLDMEAFESCLDDSSIADKVKADLREGASKGVQGTPATFVNGELIEGAYPFQTFKELIDRELGL